MAEKRIQFNNVVQNQVPAYVREEFPRVVEFLKQYYIAQEYKGGPVDLIQNIDQYLKFNNNIIESDTYKFDTLDNNEIVNIFVCNQNDYSILDIYSSSIMHCHQTSLLINTFIKLNINKETSNIYININKSTFNIIFIKNNKIQFINTFDFNTSEDLIYYILFCLEQLELNPEKIQTTISGKIFKEYYDIIYKYIRNVSIYNSNLSSKSRYYNNFKNQILNTY